MTRRPAVETAVPSGTRRHVTKTAGVRRAASLAIAATLAIGLSACTGGDPLAEQYRAGDNKGFIAGQFQVQETAPADRGEPVAFSGTVESGVTVSNADYAGQVLVVNFWYASCGPCRAEAPQLVKATSEFAGQEVAFLGINIYDQPETATSFAETYGITYPSVIAVNDGAVKLAFADAVPLSAVPVTLVLDRQGRVAARIIGEITDVSILATLVRDTLAETP